MGCPHSSDDVTLLDCGASQRDEFDVLRSMYDECELVENSHRTIGEYYNLISSFVLRLAMPSGRLDVSFQIPPAYPMLEFPDVFVRSFGAVDDRRLNKELRSWLEKQEKGQPMTTDIIMWIQENSEEWVNNNSPSPTSVPSPELKALTYSKYFIHSHHLYSTIKRADIQKLCSMHNLGGFSTPGKPAVIIIEGESTACADFWTELKTWSWQRIQLRHEETFKESSELKFLPKKFHELVTYSDEGKMIAAHQAAVKKELTDRGMSQIFPILYNL